jgi:gliding motility-associated-like protein
VIELRATISYRILERNRYAFTASTSYGTSLSWIINSREVSTATQFEHELTTGEHTVVLIATSGECVTRSAEKIVVKELQEYKELEFYQSFSPNADGINDSYLAPEAEYVEFRMTVKDQNGRIVFETSNPNHGWNGKVNGVGDGCPAASYNVEFVYKLKGEAKARRDIVPIRLFRD